MNIQTAHSNRPSAREAAGELKAGLQALVPKMVLFFSSSTYPPEDVAGEIISGQMLKNSIVAMAFNAGVIKDVQVEVLAHVHGQAAAGVPRVFADFKKHYGTAMGEADPHQYFGIILVEDRKSTRLNSSHGYISYAVFCLKKKKKIYNKL